jgi:squalene-hopene/tetraprenyl-beta-curcumene cyclase
MSTVLFLAAAALAGDWNQRLAADYLDSRQKEWLAWPTANKNGYPCVSCHTGAPYLLARPALRHVLGETERTSYETALLDSLRARLDKKTPAELYPKVKEPLAAQAAGVETIFAALLLTADSPAGKLSADVEKAFGRMWSMQLRDGESAGAFPWFSLDLDPWEMPQSAYYGAALAALAAGMTPVEYRARPEVRENVAHLRKYLCDRQAGQPLHNRMMLLWASTTMPDLLNKSEKRALVDEVLKRQQPDGAWTIESLGRFKKHEEAPAASGGNAYATALTAFILERAGARRKDAHVTQALQWLREHQDRKSGYWDAASMNKRYEEGSMQQGFMRDAATSFAVLALLGR